MFLETNRNLKKFSYLLIILTCYLSRSQPAAHWKSHLDNHRHLRSTNCPSPASLTVTPHDQGPDSFQPPLSPLHPPLLMRSLRAFLPLLEYARFLLLLPRSLPQPAWLISALALGLSLDLADHPFSRCPFSRFSRALFSPTQDPVTAMSLSLYSPASSEDRDLHGGEGHVSRIYC